jgi:hypothetical protein
MTRSLFDELQEALIKEARDDDVFDESSAADDVTEYDPSQQYPYLHKHMGYLFDKKRLIIGVAPSGTKRR